MEEHTAEKLGFYHLFMEIYWWTLTRRATASELVFKKWALKDALEVKAVGKQEKGLEKYCSGPDKKW